MADPVFTAVLRIEGHDAVVVAAGDLDLAGVPALEAALDAAFTAEGEIERVVVDMGDVEFIDSSGLTALIKANRQAGEATLGLVLRAPSARVLRTLELTRLETVLAVEPS